LLANVVTEKLLKVTCTYWIYARF